MDTRGSGYLIWTTIGIRSADDIEKLEGGGIDIEEFNGAEKPIRRSEYGS